MEGKKLMELNEEKLDEVTGGGFTKPGKESIESELMAGQKKCGKCRSAVFPKWDQAARKFICPECGADM